MDVLLSLPIVSYLLGPGAATSWSTSINVLFIYLTWTTLVLSYAPLHIALAGVLTLRVLLWMIPSLLSLAFDTGVPSLAASTKLGGAASLPPRGTTDARIRLGKLFLLAVINLVLEALLQAGLQATLPIASAGASTAWSKSWTTLSALVVKPKPKSYFSLPSLSLLPSLPSFFSTSRKPVDAGLFRTSSTLPLPWSVLKQTVLLFFMREALVYYGHRYLLSQPNSSSRLVRRLSRWHLGSYAHTRRQAPFSLLVFADHPASVFVLRWLPLYLPTLLVRPHVLVFFCFAGLVTFEETMGMSGYRVVPGLLLRGIARRTAAHYNPAIVQGEPAETPRRATRRRKGQATIGEEASTPTEGVNFGAWGLLDWVQGTSWPRSGSLVADAQASAAAVPGLSKLQGAAATVVSHAMVGDGKQELLEIGSDDDEDDEDYDDDAEEEEVVVEKKTRAKPQQNGRRKKKA
ncbi:hypothetical protein SBRCBS47491_001875 [Sporothrix bragantina]|uniref:Fatty acid hydroxylase domain-containing protein n=1 Tax=Sporothrix bragantina TaxID=671064 RepID=A0ABP0B2U8_9PEZI